MPGPVGDYTPFGYLRNPAHRATDWKSVEGGNLRTMLETIGVEWVYPHHQQASAGAGISLATWSGHRACVRRADFAAIGLTSRYHSANMLGFDWQLDEVAVAARFFLADDHALALRVGLTNVSMGRRQVRLSILGCAWGADADSRTQDDVVHVASGDYAHALVSELGPAEPSGSGLAPGSGWSVSRSLDPGEQTELVAVLGRATDAQAATELARAAVGRAAKAYRDCLAADAAFHASCPQLAGDWPPAWRQGLVYDFETTRLLVQPPGGVFEDVWPAWMMTWPRVVLAEGTLDMLRLAYADPRLAQRAVLSLFRDAPAPNVPCVFWNGEFNMVATDGSRCGTSPAWCLPFLNLQLLYLRTLDRYWLEQVYPYLAAYLSWWLEHRTDARGWVVYKCTWESGEDGSPRLDPGGNGDADISKRVRPVELQATVAHAAGVLAFFARELDRGEEMQRWVRLRAAYRRRTRQLFDPETGRFRDWLIQEARFQEPRPDQPYWGVDACRYSPLGLTPLLLGRLGPIAEQEIWRHATAPWTAWPSWSYVLLECAAAAGLYEGVGEIAAEIIDRVYRVTDRRSLADISRPLPGAAPEFWPHDWQTFQGTDAYGWGATTAHLLIRHIFGLKESPYTRGWRLVLTPALPRSFRVQGRRYTIRQVQYRGVVLDLTYTFGRSGLEAEFDLGTLARRCTVRRLDGRGRAVYASRRPARHHRFPLQIGQAYWVELT